MEEKEFEKHWQANRQHLLAKDPEWKALQESYKMQNGADWLLFAIPAVAGVASFNYIPVERELLKWIVCALITIVCFALCVLVKSLTSGINSADEIERRVKEDYRKTLKEQEE